MNGEHSIKRMVTTLLLEIISEFINKENVGQTVIENEEEESTFLRDRNIRVAAIQAEFQRMFPQFENEVEELRVGRKGKRKKKPSPPGKAARRSSRVAQLDRPSNEELNANCAGGLGDDLVGGENGGSDQAGERAGGQYTGGVTEAGAFDGEGRQGGALFDGERDGGERGGGVELGGGGSDQAGGVSEAVAFVADEESAGGGLDGAASGGRAITGEGGQDVPGGDPVGQVIGEADLFGGGLGSGENPDLGRFGCIPCMLSFRDRNNLKRHVQLVHQARLEAIKCSRSWCKAEFIILAEMKQHLKGCVMVCPYSDCLKTFIRPEKLAAHERGHLVMARRMAD